MGARIGAPAAQVVAAMRDLDGERHAVALAHRILKTLSGRGAATPAIARNSLD